MTETLTRAKVLDAAQRLRDAADLLLHTEEVDEALEVAARAQKVSDELRGAFSRRTVEMIGV